MMMYSGDWARKAAKWSLLAATCSLSGGIAAIAGAQAPAQPSKPEAPTANYWVYVGAESADLLQRLRFGPGGFVVEKTIQAGELIADIEGPHGIQITKDGKWMFVSTGHGNPDGKFWKYALGPDTLVGAPIFLGFFPASLDVTPDGLYAFVANFNLHGDMVPSSQSVVYTPTNTEVARITTCTMPHGSRVAPDGRTQYSACMMDDQLVEIDAVNFEVARRFSVAKGNEKPISADVTMAGHNMAEMDHAHPTPSASKPAGQQASEPAPPLKGKTPPLPPGQAPPVPEAGASGLKTMAPATCSPTWAQPSADGSKVYVACNKGDEIDEIDKASWTLTRKIKTGRGPYKLAVTPDGKLLLATLKPAASFEIYDIATGKIVATLKNSTTVANGIAVSPDSRYAFVSSEGVGAAPGKVDVYDLRAFAKVGTVDVGQQAGGIAFWKMEPKK
jgi:DNA-binding beta-propeller fold protein YncE